IVAVTNGVASIDDWQVDGQVEADSGNGISQSVRPPIHRVIRMNSLGTVLGVEHKPIVGVKTSGGAFLEGFSLPLPEKPPPCDMVWSGTNAAKGLDGRPISVKYICKYQGEATHGGHRCAKIVTDISSAFQTAVQGASKRANCDLAGSLITWFALDIGRDEE